LYSLCARVCIQYFLQTHVTNEENGKWMAISRVSGINMTVIATDMRVKHCV